MIEATLLAEGVWPELNLFWVRRFNLYDFFPWLSHLRALPIPFINQYKMLCRGEGGGNCALKKCTFIDKNTCRTSLVTTHYQKTGHFLAVPFSSKHRNYFICVSVMLRTHSGNFG